MTGGPLGEATPEVHSLGAFALLRGAVLRAQPGEQARLVPGAPRASQQVRGNISPGGERLHFLLDSVDSSSCF